MAGRQARALNILTTSVLALGTLRRERLGIASTGFESALIFLLYLGGAAMLIAAGEQVDRSGRGTSNIHMTSTLTSTK